MLVLTRRLDDVIRIGPDIEVMVVRLGSNRVRLGITAPKSVSITRHTPPVEERQKARKWRP